MSLIVAKKQNNQIYIVSDTKLTNPNNLNRIDLVAPEEFSAIKIVNINPFVSISFAGEISYAKQAIATCRKLDNNINRILDYLLQTNITSNNATEFIVCINLPTFFIYEIKNIEDTTFWGSKNLVYDIVSLYAKENTLYALIKKSYPDIYRGETYGVYKLYFVEEDKINDKLAIALKKKQVEEDYQAAMKLQGYGGALREKIKSEYEKWKAK